MSNSDNVSNGVWEKQPSVCAEAFLDWVLMKKTKKIPYIFSKKNCLPIDSVKAENAT